MGAGCGRLWDSTVRPPSVPNSSMVRAQLALSVLGHSERGPLSFQED